jgi:hypothetical protein
LPSSGDNPTPGDSSSDSTTVKAQGGEATSVAKTNNGSPVDVDASNKGSKAKSTSSVEPGNQARPTTVAPANTTKNQYSSSTTTTTNRADQDSTDEHLNEENAAGMGKNRTVEMTASSATAAFPASSGPGGKIAPGDAPGETAAIQAFEDANGRPSTPAERHLLRGLAVQAELDAIKQGGAQTSGWSWVTAATYEAVEAGSSFVAPRRLREIISRWARDGAPGSLQSSVDREPTVIQSEQGAEVVLGEAPDFDLPHGHGSARTWAFTVSRLGSSIVNEVLRELVGGTAITGYREGEVTIAVANHRQAEQMSGGYRTMIERALGEAMRRPIRLAIIEPDSAETVDDEQPDMPEIEEIPARSEPEEQASFLIPECGMTSDQVWTAMLAELSTNGEIPPANVSAWLRPARLIGRSADGSLILGAPHTLAQRRIETRFHQPVEDAAARVIGMPVRVEAVVASTWLAANPGPKNLFTGDLDEQTGA